MSQNFMCFFPAASSRARRSSRLADLKVSVSEDSKLRRDHGQIKKSRTSPLIGTECSLRGARAESKCHVQRKESSGWIDGLSGRKKGSTRVDGLVLFLLLQPAENAKQQMLLEAQSVLDHAKKLRSDMQGQQQVEAAAAASKGGIALGDSWFTLAGAQLEPELRQGSMAMTSSAHVTICLQLLRRCADEAIRCGCTKLDCGGEQPTLAE